MSASAATTFTALTAPHHRRLFRLGMRLTREPHESADLVQETLTRAWVNWRRVQAGGSIGAYLSRILVNAFISRHRHAKVVAAAADRFDLAEHLFDPLRLVDAAAPEVGWHDRGLSDEIVAALDTLPTRYRRVVELVDLQGIPYKEAARTLGIPLGTVMSRLHRARRAMREPLRGYAETRGFASSEADAAAA